MPEPSANPHPRAKSTASRALSVPTSAKVVGIAAIVALVFSAVTVFQVRVVIIGLFHHMLHERAGSGAAALAVHVERRMADGAALEDLLTAEQRSYPEIAYAVVRNREGIVLANTFGGAIPPEVEARFFPSRAGLPPDDARSATGAYMVDVVQALPGGATLQMGVSDKEICESTREATRTLVWGLGLCALLSLPLSFLLARLMTRPLHRLAQASKELGAGNTGVRVDVTTRDEAGRLGEAFNAMAVRIDAYRRELEEKERVRLALSERIIDAQENERRAISLELHDQIGQSLLALLLHVRTSCNGMCDEPRRRVEERIQALVDDVRRISWGLRPPMLDEGGLEAALDRYLREAGCGTGIQFDYQYSRLSEAPPIPQRIEVALYRVAQEAVANVIRHSKATRASVVVLQAPGKATLVVEDQGAGGEAGDHRTGLGIAGMRERAELLGGSLSFEQEQGKGTLVRVCVPLLEEKTS